MILTTPFGPNKPDSHTTEVLMKLLGINVFVILPSFAISIAGKYLKSKS